ncbi:MAG: hypothetical protein OXB96_01445 [Candidatus Kaiserbacteria bacterium]|nr:hypothetical protein [Candidatus Kaiserbacteria bacterium]
MAQNKKQEPKGVKSDSPVQQNSKITTAKKGEKKDGGSNKVAPAQQQETVDTASIDALGADASGAFIRSGEVGKSKKGAPKQKVSPKNPPEKTASNKREGYAIPVLRTYHHDTRSIAQTKGGAELRTILAKEAEEKQRARKEYIKNTKDIMKESAILRDKYRNVTQGKQVPGASVAKPGADGTADEQEDMMRTLSNATEYMRSAQGNTVEQEKAPSQQESKKTDVPPKEKSKQPNLTTPTTSPEEKAGESTGRQEPEEQMKEKEGIFARVLGRAPSKNILTQEQREELRQKQQESIEKEEVKNAWKNFKQKRKKLREMGMRARDVRSYAASPDGESIPNKPLQRQNMLLLAIVFFLLAGLLFSVIFLALNPTEEPTINNAITTGASPTADVLSSENQVSIEVTGAATLPDAWQSITEKDGGQDTVTKYVPYITQGEEKSQLSFEDFSRSFGPRFPPGLQNAFSDYYFVGKYLGEREASGIFIASVKRYGDAFVWMRNWEKNAINALSPIFPGMFRQSNINNVTIESRVIDNQDVRVIRNTLSQNEILYYFFGRSILVFIAGEESTIPLINARIRSANAL